MRSLYLLPLLVLFVACGSAPKSGEIVNDASIIEPFSTVFDRKGNLFGVEFLKSNRVFQITPSGKVIFIAGIQAVTDNKTGDRGAGDGPDPLTANFNGMHDLAIGPDGSIYLADTFNARVRKIDGSTGVLTTLIGNGEKGFSGEGGPASQARIGGVYCLSFNQDYSRLYLADLPNQRILFLDMKTGNLSSFAGTGEAAAPEDGALAIRAPLLDPRAVVAGKQGEVYILSRRGNSLLVVDSDGKIRTVVNAAGDKGYAGDGGLALTATMNGPKHLALDEQGRVLISDTENHCIRRYDPATGTMTLIAGMPQQPGGAFSGNPLETQLARPHGSRVYDGWIYISDSENNRVLKFPYPNG